MMIRIRPMIPPGTIWSLLASRWMGLSMLKTHPGTGRYAPARQRTGASPIGAAVSSARMRSTSRRRKLSGVIGAALVAVLLGAPAAGAHELTVDRAESAAERYADEEVGGGLAQVDVDIRGQPANLSVDGYDSAPCQSLGVHRRLCRVTYEGQDFLELSCRVAPIMVEGRLDSRECFSRVSCTQRVTVTLTGRHVSRRSSSRRRIRRAGHIGTVRDGDLTLTGSDLSCSRG